MKARENPFATHRVERLAFRLPVGLDWESLLRKLESQGYCGAIVGRHGAGKSTLLEQIQPHLKELGFEPHLVRLRSDATMREKEALPELIRKIVKPGFVLLDGAEQLSTRHWLPVRSAAGNAAGFVVTVHRVSRLPALLECETNPRLLAELVRDLGAQLLSAERASELHARHFGNMRECLRELYDEWSAEARSGLESKKAA
jgi:hypothetical protein